jgi:hypothetical protein
MMSQESKVLFSEDGESRDTRRERERERERESLRPERKSQREQSQWPAGRSPLPHCHPPGPPPPSPPPFLPLLLDVRPPFPPLPHPSLLSRCLLHKITDSILSHWQESSR